MKRWIALLVSMHLFPIAGCGWTMEEYTPIHKSARNSIPWAVELERHFGAEGSHFISNFGARSNHEWHSVAYIGERYILTMAIAVKIDYAQQSVTPQGQPTFYLLEVKKVTVLSNGQVEEHFGDQWVLTESDWEKVTDDGDIDFGRIGIKLNSQPTKDFEKPKLAETKDRIMIKLLEDK